jgi:hypothetical protein
MTTDIVKPKPAAAGLSIAVLLAGLSIGFFVVVALATGETAQLGGQSIVGLLQRMVALGLVFRSPRSSAPSPSSPRISCRAIRR